MELQLKSIRKNAGYSNAAKFAKFMNMPEKTYRNYEQGVRGITLELACELCNALECSIDELAGRKTATPTLTPYERELIAAARACDNTRKQSLLIAAKDAAMCSSVATGGGGGYSKKKHYSVKFKVYAGGVRSKQVIRYAALKKTKRAGVQLHQRSFGVCPLT